MTDKPESSRYVTVLHQTKPSGNGEPGDRFVLLGEHYNGTSKLDKENGEFIKIARALAVIDVGTELEQDELTKWCNSHAGQHVLSRYFDHSEPDDPTLPDTEDIRDGDSEVPT